MSWADLPTEILNLIRQRLLSWEDYSNFRATCHGWNFKADFDRTVYDNVSYPFLVRFYDNGIDDKSPSYCEAYSPAYNKTYHVRAPSLLLDAHIFCSNHGWLLLARGSRPFFYHPSTERIVKLPVVESGADVPFQSMSFSAAPTSRDCMVIGITDSKSEIYSSFSVIGRGWRSWRHYSHVPNRMRFYNFKALKLDLRDINKIEINPKARVNFQKRFGSGRFLWSGSSCPPIFYKEAFYCLSRYGRLGAFRPKEKNANKMWRVFDLTAWIDVFVDHPCNEAYLVECRGELLCIVVSYTGQRVRILRFYEKKKAWQIIHSLENHTIWLSSAGCVALKCDDKLEGLANTIHFPRLHQSRRHVFYSVPTEQFHSFGGDYVSDDICDTKLLLTSAWVVPSFSVSSGVQPRWSSKFRQRRKDGDIVVHPHYVIRSLTLSQPPADSTACLLYGRKQDGNSKTVMQEEAEVGQLCILFSNGEGEDLLVKLDEEPIINHSRHLELAARIDGRSVLGSACGMLILGDYYDTCYLLDPMSMIETTLPAWEANFFFGAVVLQRDSELLVMAFGSYRRNEELEAREVDEEEEEEEEEEKIVDVAMVWQEGDNTWAVHKRLVGQGIVSICGVVAYGGMMYALDYEYHLAAMELGSDRWIVRPMKEVEFPISYRSINVADRFNLVESCGELLLFFGYYRDGYYLTQPDEPKSVPTDIKVFKMDWQMMRWRMVEDLGDRAFLWCKFACYTCCASKSGFQKNSIYIFENKDAELYVFDYRDRTISISAPYRNIVHEDMVADSFMLYE